MAAIAHGWHPPSSSGIHVPISVAKEFNQADAGTGILGRLMKKKRNAPMRKAR
jgi:hypothetical protein